MTIVRRSAATVALRRAPNRSIAELISAAEGGARGVTLRIVEMLPASQQGPRQPHAHPGFEEVIYVLEGRARIWQAGETLDLQAGDAVVVPAGALHATFNLAEGPLRLACFFPAAAGVDDVALGPEPVRP